MNEAHKLISKNNDYLLKNTQESYSKEFNSISKRVICLVILYGPNILKSTSA